MGFTVLPETEQEGFFFNKRFSIDNASQNCNSVHTRLYQWYRQLLNGLLPHDHCQFCYACKVKMNAKRKSSNTIEESFLLARYDDAQTTNNLAYTLQMRHPQFHEGYCSNFQQVPKLWHRSSYRYQYRKRRLPVS
jgi:hypothetical protein